MTWTTLRWINCRASAAYVTDGANQTVLVEATPPGSGNVPAYPKSLTVASDTFNAGWASESDGARNDTTSGDVRLAGCHKADNTGTQKTIQIDLGAARTINLHLGMGRGADNTNPYWQVMDNNTVLETVDKSASGTTTGQFYDATGTKHTSAANWAANESAKQYSITSGTLKIKIGTPGVVSNNTAIATIGIQEVSGAPYSMAADQGSYALNGQTAGMLHATIMPNAQGSYALTGQDITLTRTTVGQTMAAAQGSFSLLGSDALVDTSVVFAQGSYTLTGQAINTLAGYLLTAVQGAYSLLGKDIGLIWSNAPIVNGTGCGFWRRRRR